MNHSKAFWAVRNQYAEQMRILWTRSYTGEGLWGRGALLRTGEFEDNTVRPDEILPEHLCGGTYRSSRRRKRRPTQQLSYQERKERRIRKRFGANGVALGGDEDVKAQLEKGKKKTQAKPRVASSNRGRELRAAAALARFGQQQKKEGAKKPADVIDITDDDYETASDAGFEESASEAEQEEDALVDINGQRLVDKQGRSLVKVCEDENPEDGDAQNELRELQLSMSGIKTPRQGSASATAPQTKKESDQQLTDQKPKIATMRKVPETRTKGTGGPGGSNRPLVQASGSALPSGVCPMCSFDSSPGAATCSICSHVLDPAKVSGSWRCKGPACLDSLFLNAGDSGVCGVCGERRTLSR